MTNAERERAIQVLEYYGEKLGCKAEFDLAIKALEKDKCSSCKHYDKDYGETCLNPEGTCRVFAYDGYEKGGRE